MRYTLFNSANSTAERWLDWMIASTLESTLLLALLGMVWLAIRKHAAPQLGYGLFLLVPLKLLLPVDVIVPSTIANSTPAAIVRSWFATSPEAARRIVHSDSDAPTETRTAALPAEIPLAASSALQGQSDLRPIAADPDDRRIPKSAGLPATTASPIPAAAGPLPRLSISALTMVAWLVGVLFLLGRLVRTQWRFLKRLQLLAAADGSQLGVDLQELLQRSEVTQAVCVVECDDLAAPAVWGIARPTIILPRGIASSLTPRQLQWVLLHELAHVRRRDLAFVVLQRCAGILHFFNPVVWIANLLADRLREYACDDLAAAKCDGSAVESGEAFVKVLRHATHSRRGLSGALGVFGLESRAACFDRVRRLLDSDRPIRTRSCRWALSGLLLFACVVVPHLRAAGDPESDSAAGKKATAGKQPAQGTGADDAPGDQSFELLVVGPDGKPVPEAVVELRTSPDPAADQIRLGKFVRKGPYGTFVTTDTEGRLVVKFAKSPSNFNVSVTTPGYGPYWAGWSSDDHDQPRPYRFTAELEAGWSVGGIVVDSEGQPVEGVKVGPSIEFKKRPGDTRQLGVGTNLKTDAHGKWRFDSVPASMSEVFAEISHSGFMPNRRPLTRSEFRIERGEEPTAKIVLDRGLTVTGKVTDEAGTPVVGALVRTKFLNDIRESKTGDDGVYRLQGCEPRMTKIVVSAKGRATDMQEVRVDAEMDPVDFQMKPGGKIRIRVLDEHDHPVPKARIFFQRWRGPFFAYFEFDHVSQYADENGVWEWNETPLDEFQADICRPDGMQLGKQSLIARDEEYVFHPPAALVISGNVIDAETKKPIKKFRVVRGVRGSETQMNWVNGEPLNATDGKYRIRQTQDYFAHLIRIEANGYQAAVSRDIKSGEGNVSIDFELKKGIDMAATVLTPDGKPAARARVALGVAGSQINVKSGQIDEGSTYCERQDTGESGIFRFPPQDRAFQLVIMHPTGYAHVKATPESMPETIELHVWARVEGTFRIGKETVSGVPLTINSGNLHSFEKGVPRIFEHLEATTGKDGRFTFERVVAGRAGIGRRIMLMVNDGATEVTSSCITIANFLSGETTQIDLGGSGRAVTGQLQPPKGFDGKVLWNFALISVYSYLPEPPMPDEPPIPADIAKDAAKKAAWMLKWQVTPAGNAWTAWKTVSEEIQRRRDTSPRFTASINLDGTFRIDDMPAGDYSLSVRFQRDAAGHLFDYRFAVPPMEGQLSDEELDLGVLTLEKR